LDNLQQLTKRSLSSTTEEIARGKPEQPPAHRHEQLQIAGTGFAVLFCVVGIALWGLPFFYDFMVQQFGWTRAQVTSGNAVSKLLVGPLFGFVAGWMVDRFGPRRIMISGILFAGVALIGLGGISSLGMFYFFYVFNALGYVLGGPLPIQVLLSRWFDKSRGKAMGFAYLGIGVGGTLAPWISHALVQHFGWQSALRILGLLVLVIALPPAIALKKSAPTTSGSVTALPPAKSAFRSMPFYLLIVGSMASIAAVTGTQYNLKLFLTLDRHYSQAEATRVVSLVLAFSIAGRLIMGWLADHFSKKHVMLGIYLLIAIAIPLLFLGRTQLSLYAFAVIFGIGLGGDYMIIPLMTAEIFGVKSLGRLMGVLLAAGGVAEALSPWWTGHLRDLSGSYSTSCVALVGMALLGAIAVLALPGHREPA
jgi:MFS family permease